MPSFLTRLRWRFAKVHPSPIFVLGNQKSGTTVIASLLAARVGTESILDIFFRLGDFSVEDRLFSGDTQFSTFLRDHRRFFVYGVIKDPSLTFFRDELKESFPGSRFVFVVRDPRDNLRSILNRLGLKGTISRYDRSVQATLETNPGWRGILEGRNPPSTRREGPIETLSARWVEAARAYLARSEHCHLIRYEDFCREKVGSITQLGSGLGFSGGRDISRLVDRQYQPKGDHSISWEGFFGRRNLATIENICGGLMAGFGYPRSTSGR